MECCCFLSQIISYLYICTLCFISTKQGLLKKYAMSWLYDNVAVIALFGPLYMEASNYNWTFTQSKLCNWTFTQSKICNLTFTQRRSKSKPIQRRSRGADGKKIKRILKCVQKLISLYGKFTFAFGLFPNFKSMTADKLQRLPSLTSSHKECLVIRLSLWLAARHYCGLSKIITQNSLALRLWPAGWQ